MFVMTKTVMSRLGFKYKYRLSTRDPKSPEKYLGDPKTWDKVEAWAEEIMKRHKIEHFTAPGEAAFYAPKMDLIAIDSLGREWQLSTVQIDYVQPARFNLKYTDSDGTEKTPVMLHRAILGSSERMLMILIEHYAGAFPFWLAPVQIKVLPITERNLDYSTSITQGLIDLGFRVEIDNRNETLSAKIRNAQNEKTPYMIIVGDKEQESQQISVRTREGNTLSSKTLIEFQKDIIENINT